MLVLLMVLALSKLALAEKDNMVDFNLIGTKMGLRIIKRYGNYMRVGSYVDKDENIFCWIHKQNKSLLKCIYVGI